MEDNSTKAGESDLLVVEMAGAVYAFCLLIFLFVVVALYVCKFLVIDADPAQRDPPVRIVRGKKRPTFTFC